jgi:hypothetical protein
MSSRSDDPDLLAMLAAFLGTTPEALAGADVDDVRARLATVRGSIGKLMAMAAAAEPDENQLAADMKQLRDSLAGIDPPAGASGDDAPRLAGDEARAIDPRELARALETLTAWVSRRQPGAGGEIDALLADLERTVGRLLPGAAAEAAKRDERIRSDAQSSIAEHLRRAGIKPSNEN